MISLNSEKSMFIVIEGQLLSHVISKDCILVDPERTKAISHIPLPHNKKTMQCFFNKISFVRHCVSNFE